ncbi:alpha/beta fold hydrolase [Gilvimarinus sp. F26214L]|uniref:alpha/beta fold hydrolase n=1 Tax=Gilvimarinus sp. DZF01 TaxID=3461371 RepID=UPI004045B594
MKALAICIASSLLFSSPAFAQTCPDTSRFNEAREVVRDLNRIVAPSGIQDSYKTRVGGIDQWLNVRGQDKSNPMILFVHGGPAAPVTPSMWQFQRPLEEYFTIVNWDQRGAGKTFGETDPARISDTIRISRFVDDAIEVAEHIRERYKQDKVLLMGHSWGTIVGMHAALKRPDLFHAYVGIGQVINTRENERISFEYGLSQARANDNEPAVRELASIAPYPGDEPITRERIVLARKWAQYYGGLSAFRNESNYYYKAPRLSPEYSDKDRCSINAGNVFTLGRILPEFLEVDFSAVDEFPIPVVMLMGRHDYTTPSEPTAAWMKNLDAPYKRAVWFERSSHMVPWEEPGKLLVTLLETVHPLATQSTE